MSLQSMRLSLLTLLICGRTALGGEDASAKPITVETDRYVLTAPDRAELASAQKELDYAAEQFERYFGEPPPKIEVVVFDSPDAVKRPSKTQGSDKKLPFLPFVSRKFL